MSADQEIEIVFLVLVLIIAILGLILERRSSHFRLMLEMEKARTQEKATNLANNIFSEWSKTTLDGIRNQISESLKKEYEAHLSNWKNQEEDKIRKDAIQKSINTLLGKIGEEFSPVLLANKYEVNLKDFRHLGTPVDFVAFKGLSDDTEDMEIIFLEIKSGKSGGLIERERKVRDAVNHRRIRYEVVNINRMIGSFKENL